MLAVFINEDAWQGLDEGYWEAITGVLDRKAEESLEWAAEHEPERVEEPRATGMNVVAEAEGLDIEAFRTLVLAQIETTSPTTNRSSGRSPKFSRSAVADQGGRRGAQAPSARCARALEVPCCI